MKIGIIACGAIVREMIAVAKRQEWEFELTAIPAQLHNYPAKIAPALQQKLDAWAGRFDLILVGFGDCGTAGAIDKLLELYPHAHAIPGPHCYEFFGGKHFDQQNEAHLGTFYLTDFLARHFDGLVWKGLGLDRYPQIFDLYFKNYTHLMYIQQQDENDQSLRAQKAAERMGLQYVHVHNGLDELEARLVSIVEGYR